MKLQLFFISAIASISTVTCAEPFPFVLPWDDATPSITNMSEWNEKPAGKAGFMEVREGHLFSGGKRVRIFGVNTCFGGNFPTREAAPKVAARMAKLGINCVRFHHMDMMSTPGGIFAKDGKTLDPERLDRLDFFIAQLKEQGIYADLNLHVSRTHPDRPKSEKQGNPSYDKGVDNFSAPMIALQKEFAASLLSHVNPYTGKSYAQEPAVAFVEINNENALLSEWHNGGLDECAAPYRAELGKLWTQWLDGRHGEKLTALFATGARTGGDELLKNGDFSRGKEGWLVEGHEGTKCDTEFANGSAQLTVSGAAKEAWHAQLNQGGIKLDEDGTYTVRFRAKASKDTRITIGLSQAHEPWKTLANKSIELTSEWRDYRADFKVDEGDSNARLSFSGLAKPGASTTYQFGGVTLKSAEIEGHITRDAAGQIPPLTRDEYARRTPVAQEEWIRFLWETEAHYWVGMKRYLREELGVRSLIVGTQLGWSPFPIQEQMDVIDSHAYWQHPHFPGRSWNLDSWTIKNVPMAGAPDGGTLPGLALQRVAGRPYICTEYNHSAPNLYGAETFPLVCAFAALQDWDGVFAFAYCHRGDDWDKQFFDSFFDIDQHPVKLATLTASLAMFRRGDVQAARETSFASVNANDALMQVGRSGPRLGAEQFGVKRMESFIQRVGIRLSETEIFNAHPAPSGPEFQSDTAELRWMTAQGDRRLVVNAPLSKAVIGDGNARSFDLGEVRIVANSPWACVQATVIDGDSFADAKRILITATATAENTDMKWRDAEKTTVGRDWGHAPSLAEGVSATVRLPAKRPWKAWSLDEKGQRRDPVPMEGGSISLKPEYRTLWYEVARE